MSAEPYIYNRLAAAKQDYEMAAEERLLSLERFDATDSESVSRLEAARDRLELARKRYEGLL